MRKYFCYVLLLILPFMMVFTTLYINKAKGPYWVGMNCDPDSSYMLNALNLARMKKVGHPDHPGTTVQAAGAIVLRSVHFLNFFSKHDLQTDVLKNPEFYLSVINKVFLGLNTLMLMILGIWLYCLTKNLPISIIVQFSPFLPSTHATFLFGLTGVRPESFLFLATLLFVFIIIIYAYKDTEKFGYFISNTRYIRRFSPDLLLMIFFAVISGFGLATKFSFIPLLVIPLIVLPTYKSKLKFIVGTSISFVFFTLPIIKEYRKVFDWLFSIGTHAGVHGKGAEKVVDLNIFMSNIKALFSIEKFFIYILFFSMCLLTIGYVLPWFRKASFKNIHFKLLLGVSLAQILGIVMICKVSSGWQVHYLLPVSSLSGISLILIILCMRQLFYGYKSGLTGTLTAQRFRHVMFNLDSRLLLLIIIPFLFYVRKNEIINVYNWKSQEKSQKISVYLKAENEYKDYVKIYYLGSSSPAFALRLGSEPAYAINYDDNIKRDNSEIFNKLYPNVYFYRIFNRKFYDWDNEVAFEEILSRHGKNIIFQGPRFEELFSGFDVDGRSNLKTPKLSLIDVLERHNDGHFSDRRETIYEINISPENGSGKSRFYSGEQHEYYLSP